MYAEDFEYDGRRLSDYGLMICTFGGSSGVETISTGAQISLTTVSRFNNRRRSIVNANYAEYMKTTFYVAKNPCVSVVDISPTEYREIVKWLNRRRFIPLRFLSLVGHSPDPCYFNAMCNIQKVTAGDRIVGIEISVETDSPFGYGEERKEIIMPGYDGQDYVDYFTDEVGFIYPNVKITLMGAGNLTIHNSLDKEDTVITNCSDGEVITMDGEKQSLHSNLLSHEMYDCFNYNFIKLISQLNQCKNRFTSSVPCSIQITYKPIIRDLPL